MAAPPRIQKTRSAKQQTRSRRALRPLDSLTYGPNYGTTKSAPKMDSTSSRENTSQSGATAARTFPFLQLPAELRDIIYEHTAQITTAHLQPSARGRLTSNSPLMRLSHQVHHEYTATLLLTAPSSQSMSKTWTSRTSSPSSTSCPTASLPCCPP